MIVLYVCAYLFIGFILGIPLAKTLNWAEGGGWDPLDKGDESLLALVFLAWPLILWIISATLLRLLLGKIWRLK